MSDTGDLSLISLTQGKGCQPYAIILPSLPGSVTGFTASGPSISDAILDDAARDNNNDDDDDSASGRDDNDVDVNVDNEDCNDVQTKGGGDDDDAASNSFRAERV
jgi:hypothetical protein